MSYELQHQAQHSLSKKMIESPSETPHGWVWNLIRDGLRINPLANIQLDSYNTMITTGLRDRICGTQCIMPVIVDKQQILVVTFGDLYIDTPFIFDEHRNRQPVFPDDARIRDLTYETSVSCNVTVDVLERATQIVIDTTQYTKLELFRLPVMVGSAICTLNQLQTTQGASRECSADPGGYFIFRGKERVLVSQEIHSYNDIQVFDNDVKSLCYTEVRSVKENADYSVKVQVKLNLTGEIALFLKTFSDKQAAPIAVVFAAMGTPPRELASYLELESDERTILDNSTLMYDMITQDDALECIAQWVPAPIPPARRVAYVRNVLCHDLFPHLGIHALPEDHTRLLGRMVRRLIQCHLGKRPIDLRDDMSQKRIETAGRLMTNLIHTFFKRMVKAMQSFMEKSKNYNVQLALQRSNFTQRFYQCFTTGNWGLKFKKHPRQGVSQTLNRLNYLSMVSHLRRITISFSGENRSSEMRQLHPTTFGFICCTETPEGASSGTVKNFAMMTRVSEDIPTVYVIDILVTSLPFRNTIFDSTAILINGVWIGSLFDTEVSYWMIRFRELRNMHLIPTSVSVVYDAIDREIRIASDSGRVLRPLFRVYPGWMETIHQCISETDVGIWESLLRKHAIVYVDASEVEGEVIAMWPGDTETFPERYTMCEIHPSLMLGICGHITPFPDHSQAPRNIYSAAMMKQGMGIYALSYPQRFDTSAHVLYYPQKRIVNTMIPQVTGVEDMVSGINCVVAIMTYSGFNMEDSIIMNQSAIDRGLFRSVAYKSISTEEHKRGTHDKETIELPPPHLQEHAFNYSLLEADGIVGVGAVVQKHDVLVGKIMYENDIPTKDCSLICMKQIETGVVDKVCVTVNASGYKLVKIRIRNIRIPEIGDKFASQEAQKGTIGMVYHQEDMPFNSEGICPDIILNPHAIPSRMTINMLMELVCGKACAFDGQTQDATAFCHPGEDCVASAAESLKERGFEPMGYENMTNGMTGESFKCQMFMGLGYYQRLKHLVSEKCHARARGDVEMLSRQPCAGRSRAGGLRLGEMEKDALLSHGVSGFLRERLFDMSDPYTIDCCTECGAMVHHINECPQCGHNKTDTMYIPYACKLLIQELQTLGLSIRVEGEEL